MSATTDKILSAATDLAIIGGTVAVVGSAAKAFTHKKKKKLKRKKIWQ